MDTLVIATDFSPAADNAVNYGIDLARHFNSRIVLVTAYSLPLAGYDSVAPPVVLSEMEASAMRELEEIKSRIVARTGFDPGVDFYAGSGSPMSVISEAVEKYTADVVVLGMVGKAGSLKRHLIGSTSLEAARGLDVPVFVIPEGVTYKPIRNISFACDFEKVEESTIIYTARSFSALFNATLEIVNISPKAMPLTEKAATRHFIDRTLGGVSHKTTQIESDDPAGALTDYFRYNSSDLIILNPKRHNLFRRIFVTGVTGKLVFNLKLPMLIIQ